MIVSYMDASSGSLVAQVAVAGLAGAAVAVKLGWRRTTDRLRRHRSGGSEAEPSADQRDS